MAIEIVDFPIKNCDFPWQNVSSPEGKKDYTTQSSSGLNHDLVGGFQTQKIFWTWDDRPDDPI